MLKKIILLGAVVLSPITYAANLVVSVELPKLNVAEYHAPYTAIWIEKAEDSNKEQGDKKSAKTLAIWYDTKKKNEEGLKWLKDVRQWWRRDGRDLTMPVDGVSGATKLAGTHESKFTAGQAPLGDLAKGQYQLLVEVAREVGGREVVKIPFSWPAGKTETLSAKGSAEVGTVTLTLHP